MSDKEEKGNYRRTVAGAATILVLLLAFLIVRPFMVSILSAAALAYIFYPLYLKMLANFPKIIRRKELCAAITCVIIILLVVLPVTFIGFFIAKEARSGYLFLQESVHLPQQLPPALSQWSEYIPQFREVAADFAKQLFVLFQGILKGIPSVVLSIFITVFSTYYFLKHGKEIYYFFCDLFPLPEGRYRQILQRFDDLSRGMILGQIVVGFIQGTLAWAGFYLLGVPNPVLWGFITAIVSIIPLLGAAVVWFPVDIYLFLLAMSTGEYWKAIALLVYGAFVISLIDNILKPKIVGDHARIHPLVILFGILGGIQLFGLPGLLIGPLILTIVDVVIGIYKETI